MYFLCNLSIEQTYRDFYGTIEGVEFTKRKEKKEKTNMQSRGQRADDPL